MIESEDLFSVQAKEQQQSQAPLAWRMRPQTLEEMSGQKHIIGAQTPLYRSIQNQQLHSLILYGPSGSGKTTLARLMSQTAGYTFVPLPAVTSGVSDIRKIAEEAKEQFKFYQKKTILFVDEIHRFNKGQQDVLLPYVEDGTLTLIGATTENPLFELNTALLSRLKLYILEPLSTEDLTEILMRALRDTERGLGAYAVTIEPEALQSLIIACKGDARTALNLLEVIFHTFYDKKQGKLTITREQVEIINGKPTIQYDRQGDWHYDAISAFIKSMRGSDPDAAVYWLAVMLEGGEKPEFIARRMLILASEDIGLADPQALTVANAAAQAIHFIGMPEARIILAEAALYLACAPKSNSSIEAIDAAMQTVRKQKKIHVPPHIADAHHSKAKEVLHKGVGYRYPHAFGGYVAQQYLPDDVLGTRFYQPGKNGREPQIAEFLAWIKKKQENQKN